MKGYHVPIVSALGTRVAGAAEDVQVVAVNRHARVMARPFRRVVRRHKTREAPVDAVTREVELKAMPFIVRKVEPFGGQLLVDVRQKPGLEQ
jgi:hypothetical protein